MVGIVFHGQLTWVDTGLGRIEITDQYDQPHIIGIAPDTNLQGSTWSYLLGEDIEAIAIEGIVKSVRMIISD